VLGPGRVQPDEALQLHGCDEGHRIDGHRQGPSGVVAEQPDRERHDRDQAQEQQVAHQDGLVHPIDDPEDAVMEVEGEQGDGDGEDGVGEGQHPPGLDRPAPQSVGSVRLGGKDTSQA
jgi:hypothetical protein